MNSVASVDLRDVRKQDLNHVWHPLMQYEGASEDDLLVIVSADGCEITDSDGKTYLDAYGGIWNVNVGYGRDEIVEAVYEQMKTLPFLSHDADQCARGATRCAVGGIVTGRSQSFLFCE